MSLSDKHRRRLWIGVSIIAIYALLGFFAAPWLLQKKAVETVSAATGAELRLDKVAINPFVLSLRINGLELDDPEQFSFVAIDEIFVNFQLSSLFRWAWTFDEFRVSGPQVYLSRDGEGNLNLARFNKATAAPPAAEQPAQESESMTPRLRVFTFAIADAELHWQDEVPPDPVSTRFGPVDISISDLNTLPQKPGSQTVVIATETMGTLRWDGTLQFNPFHSTGHASVDGSHFPLASAYLRHETGFDVVQGDADVELDYEVSSAAGGGVTAVVQNIDLAFQDILVRTFSGTGADNVDRDVLSLPSLTLADGVLRWPEQTVAIGSIDVNEPAIELYRDQEGELNVSRQDGTPSEPVGPPTGNDASPDPNATGSWNFELQRFAINQLRLDLEDQSVSPAAAVGVEGLDLLIQNISNQVGAEFPTTLSLQVQSGGSVALEGGLTVLPAPLFNFDVLVSDLALAGARPYMTGLADLSLDTGAIGLSGNLVRSVQESFGVNADITISDLLITETEEGSRLGSWDAVHLDGLAFSSNEQSLAISEIRMDKPYGDILITEDGSVNLGRVTKDNLDVDEPVDANPGDSVTAVGDESAALSITVGRVVIADAAADFADYSLPLPFEAQIAELGGDISTIANTSVEPSTVSLEGKVDEFGLFRMQGTVTPLEPAQNTNVQLVFQNVDVPKFSAYSIPFAGREISSGRLDLDLGYQVTDGALVGDNKIVLRDFELGEKVPHPGAMSLPLGLAVALLKDGEGKIDIDLPVSGRVDDPEFSYGGVIAKALGNLLLKIVTSPFALLGNLVGAEANELEFIDFQTGRADLAPPELEKTAKLAEALALRPELSLTLTGVVERAADGQALQTARFDLVVEARMQALSPEEKQQATFSESQRVVLEQLYVEQNEQAGSELEILRQSFFSASADAEDADAGVFDEVAYVAELRRLMVARQPLLEEDLVALATERAANAQAAVLAVDATLQSRVRVVGNSEVEGDADQPVRMQVTLTVDTE